MEFGVGGTWEEERSFLRLEIYVIPNDDCQETHFFSVTSRRLQFVLSSSSFASIVRTCMIIPVPHYNLLQQVTYP
jgi:hypothetical protein